MATPLSSEQALPSGRRKLKRFAKPNGRLLCSSPVQHLLRLT